MTNEQISEVMALLTLMSKLPPEKRKRFIYMIEGAALVAKCQEASRNDER